MMRILLLLLALGSMASVYGQKVVFEQSNERNSIPIRRLDNDDSPLNQILDTLRDARGQRNRGMLFVYGKKHTILKDKDKLEFNIQLINPRYIGNTTYRQYETADVLIPNTASFVIDWYNGSDQRLKSLFVKQTPIDKESLQLANLIQYDSLNLPEYRISTKGFEFFYDEDNLLEFRSRIDFINELYADYDTVLHKMERIKSNEFGLQRILADTSQLLNASQFVHHTLHFAKVIREKGYAQLKPAEGATPPDLFGKLNQLEQMNKRIFDSVQVVVKTQYEKSAKEIDRLIAIQDFEGAQQIVTQQLLPYGLMGEGNYYLAQIYFLERNYGFALSKMVALAENFVVTKDLKSKYLKLSTQLTKTFLDSALHQFQDEDMPRTYEYLAQVYELMRAMPEAAETASQNTAVKTQQQELFKLISDYAQEQFTAGDIQQALVWFQNTEEFCANFRLKLCDTQLADKVATSKLEFQKKLAQSAMQHIQNYDLQSAEEQLLELTEFTEMHGLDPSPLAEIANTMLMHKTYFRNLKEGLIAQDANDQFTAIEKLTEAKRIASDYHLEAPDEIDSLLYLNVNAQLEKFIVQRKESPGELDPNDVDYLHELIDELAANKRVDCKAQLMLPLDSFPQLTQVACDYKHKEYERLLHEAKATIRASSFMASDSLLQTAITLAGDYEACQINASEAESEKIRIAQGVGYEISMDNIFRELNDYNYAGALELYDALTDFHSIYRLSDQLNLTHDEPIQFIIKSENVDFINFCIGHYSGDITTVEIAVQLMNYLYHRGVSSDDAKNGQISLALTLSTRDWKKNSGRPVKEMIKKYANGDKWFRHFEEVYSIQWESLQSSK